MAEAASALDRAAKVGAIHPNNAARRKSRLMRRANAALGGEALITTSKPQRQVSKTAAAKAAKARIAAGKASKAKGEQTAAGKARAALSKSIRSAEAAAAASKARDGDQSGRQAKPTQPPRPPTSKSSTSKATTPAKAAPPVEERRKTTKLPAEDRGLQVEHAQGHESDQGRDRQVEPEPDRSGVSRRTSRLVVQAERGGRLEASEDRRLASRSASSPAGGVRTARHVAAASAPATVRPVRMSSRLALLSARRPPRRPPRRRCRSAARSAPRPSSRSRA